MQSANKFHQTKTGLLIFGLVELELAYGAASWAIDSGNVLLYIATIVLFIGGLHNLMKLVWRVVHGRQQAG